MMNSHARKRSHGGYTLIEVLVGITIFALGMMALAHLQTNLARNSTDSNARTVAINLAEELVESARTFSQIDSDGTHAAYNDIVTSLDQGYERAGNQYSVDTVVTDYYNDDGTFTTTAPTGAAKSDMKLVEITVTWNNGQEFQIDATNQTQDRLGSGSITVRDVISSITSPSGGKVALGTTGTDSYSPPVDYNPGQNPDIVSIELGQNKFKESTTPLPDVIRADELVETRFDVVTYSQNDSGATFLRREEFRAVSCECTLHLPNADGGGGKRPTIWNGNDYTEGEFVAKPYGTSANNQQSEFCDICCRDHHDGGTGVNDVAGDPGRSQYDPFRDSLGYYDSSYGALAGDHMHYKRDNQGNWVLAQSDGDMYLEACRLVRKNGFFRVAQDLRQEGLNAFPASYLDDTGEVNEYSKYVTDAVSAYETAMGATDGYEANPPTLTAPADMSPSVVFPASTYGNATQMSDALTEQQLRSRGIYLDYMSDELRTRINCLQMSNGDGPGCDVPAVTTALEIIPFYDVQLTWLARWNETPTNNPIDVSNEAVANNNTHSRGMAVLGSGFGYSTINSATHTGNLGLTATDPIDDTYASMVSDYDLYALAVDYTNPPPLSSIVVSGSIISTVPGVKAADVELEASGAQCDRTNTGFQCVIESGASNPFIKVFNYFKMNKDLYACSASLTLDERSISNSSSVNSWTRFYLPLMTTQLDIIIKEGGC